MAYKKSINHLTISKLKSKDLIEWFIGVATWKEISNVLDISHSKVFKFKRILREKVEQVPPFDALADTFTIKELNDVITMYNDYLENPENYKQNKKRSEIDLEAQTNTVNKHLAEMGNMKLETPKQRKSEESAKQEDVQESEETPKQEDVQKLEKAPEQENVQESEEAPEQEDVQESEEAPEQEDAQESEETPEQEDIQESEEAPEQEDAQESEETPEQEDIQETEETLEQEDVQESEETPEQEEAKETQEELLERHNKVVKEERDYIDDSKNIEDKKKREINFNSQKPMRIHEFWKNKKKK